MLSVGVLALQGDVAEHRARVEALGVKSVAVKRSAELESVDALIIPGGESTTISHLVDVFGLREPIERRLAGGMPVYGSCAGMIMLASTVLDGTPDQRSFIGGIDMSVRRNAFGRQVDSFESDIALGIDESKDPFHAVFIRAPWVESVGKNVHVLATVPTASSGIFTENVENASSSAHISHENVGDSPEIRSPDRIVAVRQGNLLATSFHPELTDDLRIHAYFVSMVQGALTVA